MSVIADNISLLNGDYRCHGEKDKTENSEQSHNMQDMSWIFN